MNLFGYQSYKTYVLARVKAMPRGGRGQFSQIAKAIGVHPVVVTQVLKGDRDFNEEQGLLLTEYLGLSPVETEYFLRLLARDRAGTKELKAFHNRALAKIRSESEQVKSKMGEHKELDDASRSIFYSDWTYSAARLLTSIDQYQTVEAVAERLGLSRTRMNEIFQFLIETGLCRGELTGKLRLGVTRTHLDAQSRFANMHRRNWRLKGLEGLNESPTDELFFSAPCTLSESDFQTTKADLLQVIASLSRRVPETRPEQLVCLNIDWFKVQ